jgi:hypothetical protein
MLDYVAEELSDATGWRRLLEAYAALGAAASARTGSRAAANSPEVIESPGWVARVSRVDGVEPERLSDLHGKLIATGLLSFEVAGKSGIQYQLSPLGRRALDRNPGAQEQPYDEAAASQREFCEND